MSSTDTLLNGIAKPLEGPVRAVLSESPKTGTEIRDSLDQLTGVDRPHGPAFFLALDGLLATGSIRVVDETPRERLRRVLARPEMPRIPFRRNPLKFVANTLCDLRQPLYESAGTPERA